MSNIAKMTPERVRSIRVDVLDLTGDELAQVLGMSGGRTVRRWESGERAVPPSVAILLTLMVTFPKVAKHLLKARGVAAK